MTINLPEDLENSIRAEVHSGHFASVDDAMAAAARLLLQQLKQTPPASKPPAGPPQGSLGAMREDAEWLDQAVAHAMKVREERPWRLPADE